VHIGYLRVRHTPPPRCGQDTRSVVEEDQYETRRCFQRGNICFHCRWCGVARGVSQRQWKDAVETPAPPHKDTWCVRVTTGSSIRKSKVSSIDGRILPKLPHRRGHGERRKREPDAAGQPQSPCVSRVCPEWCLLSWASRTGFLSEPCTSATHAAMSNEQQLFKQRIRRTTDGGGDSESRPRGGRFCMHVWLGGLRNARPACACMLVHRSFTSTGAQLDSIA